MVLSAALAVGAVSCADPKPSADDLEEALVRTGLDQEVAACAADALTENLSDHDLADLTLRGPGAAPVDDPKRDDDAYDQLRVAMDRCRLLQAEVAPSTTVVPSTTVPIETQPSVSVTTDGAQLTPAPDDAPTTTVAP